MDIDHYKQKFEALEWKFEELSKKYEDVKDKADLIDRFLAYKFGDEFHSFAFRLRMSKSNGETSQSVSRLKNMSTSVNYGGPKANDLLAELVKPKPIVEKTSVSGDKYLGQGSLIILNSTLEEEIGQIQKNCFKDLVGTCKEIAESRGVNWTSIMNVQSLRSMTVELPKTPEAMLRLPGVTRINFDKYGSQLLEITIKYSAAKFLAMDSHQNEKIEDDDQPSTSEGRSGGARGGSNKRKSPSDDPLGSGWTNTYKKTSSPLGISAVAKKVTKFKKKAPERKPSN